MSQWKIIECPSKPFKNNFNFFHKVFFQQLVIFFTANMQICDHKYDGVNG